MPLLAAEGLDSARLARLASRLSRADEALDAVTRGVYARLAHSSGRQVSLDLGALAAEPGEIAIRVLKRALTECAPTSPVGEPEAEPRLRLDRLEHALDILFQARSTGIRLRRTLAGRLLLLEPGGILTISPEPVRRRGRRDPVTPIVMPSGASLGMEPDRA